MQTRMDAWTHGRRRIESHIREGDRVAELYIPDSQELLFDWGNDPEELIAKEGEGVEVTGSQMLPVYIGEYCPSII